MAKALVAVAGATGEHSTVGGPLASPSSSESSPAEFMHSSSSVLESFHEYLDFDQRQSCDEACGCDRSIHESERELTPVCQICFDQPIVPNKNKNAIKACITIHKPQRQQQLASHGFVCAICNTSFCLRCLASYAEFKILEGQVSSKQLTCPTMECSAALTQDLIQSLVSRDLFAKYLHFRQIRQVGIRFCPRVDCGQVLRHEKRFAKSRRVVCDACDRVSCMKCGKDFHTWPICKSHHHTESTPTGKLQTSTTTIHSDPTQRKNHQFNKWKAGHDVRKCPNCKVDIEKRGGCFHMKCFHCDHEFCWNCLRNWHSHHDQMCKTLGFFKSKSPCYGKTAPMRVATKTAIIGGLTIVSLVGLGLAIVVVPTLLVCREIRKTQIRHRRESRRHQYHHHHQHYHHYYHIHHRPELPHHLARGRESDPSLPRLALALTSSMDYGGSF